MTSCLIMSFSNDIWLVKGRDICKEKKNLFAVFSGSVAQHQIWCKFLLMYLYHINISVTTTRWTLPGSKVVTVNATTVDFPELYKDLKFILESEESPVWRWSGPFTAAWFVYFLGFLSHIILSVKYCVGLVRGCFVFMVFMPLLIFPLSLKMGRDPLIYGVLAGIAAAEEPHLWSKPHMTGR